MLVARGLISKSNELNNVFNATFVGQVGKVADNAADFYHSRLPKKQRKRTIVDELLADAEFQTYNKRRYKEIIEERRKTNYKAHVKAKKLKRRKK